MSDSVNRVLASLSYGMYVVGAHDNEKPTGCIVNTAVQITNLNPIIAISIHKDNYTYEVIKKTGKFSVSILSEQTDPTWIGKLGFYSGRDTDKFAEVPYFLKEDLPILDSHCTAYAICEFISMHMTNTHMVMLGRVLQADFIKREAVPMTYRYYHEVVRGKASKNAPTYQQKPEKEESHMSEENVRYVCTVCGYVYEGDITKEPDDYVCPVCGVGKEMFEKMDAE